MNHGDHSAHEMPGHEMPMKRCSMNMLWYVQLNSPSRRQPAAHPAPRNTQIENTCIVFRSWHISTTHAFVFSCLAIVALGVLYEWLREAQKIADTKIAATLSAQSKGKARGGTVSGRSSPEVDSEEAGLLTGMRATKGQQGCVAATETSVVCGVTDWLWFSGLAFLQACASAGQSCMALRCSSRSSSCLSS